MATIGVCVGVVTLMLALASLLERLRDDPGTVGKRYQLTVQLGAASLADVRAVPGVADAGLRFATDAADSFRLDKPFRIVAYPGDHTRFEAPPLAAGRRLRDAGEIEVGLGLADALGLRPGSALAAQLPSGEEVRFRVAGVVRALENDGRIAWARPDRLGDLSSSVAVRLEGGADRAAVARRLEAIGAPSTRVGGASTRNAQFLGVLAAVLRGVGLAVGLVCLYALVQALAMTARERRGAVALLRACGGDAGTVALVLVGAAAAVAVPGALLGVALEAAVLGAAGGAAGRGLRVAADLAEPGAGRARRLRPARAVRRRDRARRPARAARAGRPGAAGGMRRALLVLCLALAGCGGTSGAGAPTSTLDVTLVDRDGDGFLERGPGEPLKGPRGGRVLATFGQLTDAHVRDEESPARVPFLDRLGAPLNSTFRPQEAFSTQVLDAAVRALDRERPQAVVVTGDIVDSAQENELEQALAVLAAVSSRPTAAGPATTACRPPRTPIPSTSGPTTTRRATRARWPPPRGASAPAACACRGTRRSATTTCSCRARCPPPRTIEAVAIGDRMVTGIDPAFLPPTLDEDDAPEAVRVLLAQGEAFGRAETVPADPRAPAPRSGRAGRAAARRPRACGRPRRTGSTTRSTSARCAGSCSTPRTAPAARAAW